MPLPASQATRNLFAGVLTASLLLSNATAGELGFGEISSFSDWESTDCYEPSPPSFRCYDDFSCQRAVDAFNQYVDDVRSYANCVANEGAEDIREAQDAISEGVDEAISNVRTDLDYARSDLERALSLNGYRLR